MQKAPPEGQAAVGLIFAFIVAAVVTIWKNGGIGSNSWGDTLMFGVFILFMIWLLTPRRANKRTGQDSPPK